MPGLWPLFFEQQSRSFEKHYAGCRRNHQVQDAGVRFKAKYACLLKLKTYDLFRVWQGLRSHSTAMYYAGYYAGHYAGYYAGRTNSEKPLFYAPAQFVIFYYYYAGCGSNRTPLPIPANDTITKY